MLTQIHSWLDKARKRMAADTIACFHCGDRVNRRRAVEVEFDGATRLVCCHGCAAVLNTVQQMGMQRQYFEQKSQAASGDEK